MMTMPDAPLVWRTAQELAAAVRAREVGAREVVAASLERIAAVDPDLNAFITVTADEALAAAEAIDQALAAGNEVGPLAGVPVAVKDNLCTEGTRTTAASRMLEHYVPPFDATAVRLLKQAGAVIVGKTNLDEFSMGSSTENSAFFPTRNPWSPERVPGGSSGGSAAAVASGQTPVALASDTGGSIRQPAAFCGVVGLKPTYGRVSRYGLIDFAPSFEQVGPITRTVADAALVLETLAVHDPLDSTSAAAAPEAYTQALSGDVRGLRIGIAEDYFKAILEAEVDQALRQAIDVLRGLGATLEPVALPQAENALPAFYLLAAAEASSSLARYDGIRYGHRTDVPTNDMIELMARSRAEGFGDEAKRRIMLGTYALSAGHAEHYYRKALQVRRLVKEDFDRVFERFDALIAPTTPTTAFRLGEKTGDPLTMYRSDVCTLAVNLAGVPALSVPCGFDGQGLPIGMQVIGRPFGEATILRIGDAYQRHTDVHLRRPETAARSTRGEQA